MNYIPELTPEQENYDPLKIRMEIMETLEKLYKKGDIEKIDTNGSHINIRLTEKAISKMLNSYNIRK